MAWYSIPLDQFTLPGIDYIGFLIKTENPTSSNYVHVSASISNLLHCLLPYLADLNEHVNGNDLDNTKVYEDILTAYPLKTSLAAELSEYRDMTNAIQVTMTEVPENKETPPENDEMLAELLDENVGAIETVVDGDGKGNISTEDLEKQQDICLMNLVPKEIQNPAKQVKRKLKSKDCTKPKPRKVKQKRPRSQNSRKKRDRSAFRTLQEASDEKDNASSDALTDDSLNIDCLLPNPWPKALTQGDDTSLADRPNRKISSEYNQNFNKENQTSFCFNANRSMQVMQRTSWPPPAMIYNNMLCRYSPLASLPFGQPASYIQRFSNQAQQLAPPYYPVDSCNNARTATWVSSVPMQQPAGTTADSRPYSFVQNVMSHGRPTRVNVQKLRVQQPLKRCLTNWKQHFAQGSSDWQRQFIIRTMFPKASYPQKKLNNKTPVDTMQHKNSMEVDGLYSCRKCNNVYARQRMRNLHENICKKPSPVPDKDRDDHRDDDHDNDYDDDDDNKRPEKEQRDESPEIIVVPQNSSASKEKAEVNPTPQFYPCSVCNKTFITLQGRKRHERRVHECNHLVCRICNKWCFSLEAKWQHIHDYHKDYAVYPDNALDMSFNCKFCEAAFDKLEGLTAHVQEHKYLQCATCRKEFVTIEALVTHGEETGHHTDETGPILDESAECWYQCAACQGIFPDKSTFTTHFQLQHPQMEILCTIIPRK